MALVVGTNSYISVADADTYFSNRLYSDNWDDALTADKEAALIQATRELDLMFNWYGDIADDDQSLRWPRSSVYNCDGVEIADDVIPTQIENATCEQAIYILSGDPSQKPALLEKGFKKAKLDVMEIEPDRMFRRDQIGQATISAVGCLGTVKANATVGGANTIPTIRA